MAKKKRKSMSDRFYSLLETLFKELDQDAIKAEVEALRKGKPQVSREVLARTLTRRAAIRTASIGAAAGAVGGPWAILAMAPDIFNLVRQQSRLVLSIAFIYGQRPNLPERFREVLATLAVATGASAGRRTVALMIERGLEKRAAKAIVKRVAGKYVVRRLPKIAPMIGSALGAALNFAAVHAIGKAAVEYYRHLGAAASAKPTTRPGKTAQKVAKKLDRRERVEARRKKKTTKRRSTKS
jgi:uncharacterized protein (DUF697 family)